MWSAYILSILAFSCSAQYLFAGGWIFLDLWVSSSALLLDCMCFFDFMFPFQVTAFDIWLVMLLPPLRPVVATTNCWKEIVNWNWVDIFVILFQIALQFNPFTVCYIGKCSTAQSLESSIMFSSSHILSWNLKIYIWKDKNCKRKLDTWTDETVRIANFNELFFFFTRRTLGFSTSTFPGDTISRWHHLSFRY